MTWHKNANFQDEFFEGQYKLVGHRCLYIWYSVYFIFVSDSKLDATTDLDIYLKTLKMPQITDYHQKHLHFASFGKIEPLLKSSIKSEHIVFLLFSNIYFENLSLKGCKYTSTSTKTSINTSTGVDRTSSSLAQIWPGCIIPQSLNYVFWSQIMVGSIKGSSMEMGPWVVCYNQIIFMVFLEYGSLTLYVRQDLYKGVGGSTLSSHFYAQRSNAGDVIVNVTAAGRQSLQFEKYLPCISCQTSIEETFRFIGLVFFGSSLYFFWSLKE